MGFTVLLSLLYVYTNQLWVSLMRSSASTPRHSLLIESLRNAGIKPLETTAASCSWTLNDYINQSHVSSRWQQNGRPIPLCIEFLRFVQHAATTLKLINFFFFPFLGQLLS